MWSLRAARGAYNVKFQMCLYKDWNNSEATENSFINLQIVFSSFLFVFLRNGYYLPL